MSLVIIQKKKKKERLYCYIFVSLQSLSVNPYLQHFLKKNLENDGY